MRSQVRVLRPTADPYPSAIADDTGNASSPFYFLLAMAVLGFVLLLPLDSRKARQEQSVFIREQAKQRGDVDEPTDSQLA